MSGNTVITINELFSGIGAQRKAFDRLGIEYFVVGISEIDKFAIKSYEAIFGETFNYGDIREIKALKYADLWTYSFPCTDISVAGKLEGLSENTRSGLLYQVQRLLEIAKENQTLPKYLLLENVKNLVGKKFKQKFFEWLEYLDKLGYNTYWEVLNAKNYGIPQNRERVYGISIRKDIDRHEFKFPEKEILQKRLVDVLESDVDESFYLSQKTVDYFINNSLLNEKRGNGFRFKPHNPQTASIAFSLTTKAGSRMDDNYLLNRQIGDKPYFSFEINEIKQAIIVASRGRNPENPSGRKSGEQTVQMLEPNMQGVSNTITTVQKDNLVMEYKIMQIGNICETLRFGGNPTEGRVYSIAGLAPTLCRNKGPMIFKDLRIRKLTPLECWRLMGFDDADIFKAQNAGVSNTQLYKQAGNSIVVDVLEKIFCNLFDKNIKK